jgi:uncharacterized protein (TIGR00255 family)
MFVKSMTGHGEASEKINSGMIVAEIRSTNHRFLDITTKIPESIKQYEQTIKGIIGNSIVRGKVELKLNFSDEGPTNPEYELNQDLLNQLLILQKKIKLHYEDCQNLSVLEILKWPGVINESFSQQKLSSTDVISVIKKACQNFEEFTEREGSQLTGQIQNCIQEIRKLIQKAEKLAPLTTELIRDRLTARLHTALKNTALQFSEEKLQASNQKSELLTYINERIIIEASANSLKVDIAEEIERIKCHVDEIEIVIKNEVRLKGKRLDFLAQELHREANTIGSKSFKTELSMISLDMRVFIEQIREQVQNIQ